MSDDIPNPTQIELTEAEDYSKYLLHSKKEIFHTLRSVMQKKELVTAYFNEGNDFFVTTILAVESEGDYLLLDRGPNESTNNKALLTEKIVFLTTQNKVRVQFVSSRMTQTQFNGRPVFQVAIPDSLLKLQRRDYFRLVTPIYHPIKCLIPLPEADLMIEVNVADLSVGGVGVIGYPSDIELKMGVRYPGCRIDLPDMGTIMTTLEIKNTFEVTLKNGQMTKRSGCQFINLPPSQEAMIQRYITQMERERKAKIDGN
jgi:c-di-GMP-binding flagellar brake protein YcgR